MKKYEIYTDTFELKAAGKSWPSMTSEEVFDLYWENEEQTWRLRASFDSLEEAEAEFRKGYQNYGRTIQRTNNGAFLLLGDVAILIASEYDDDGEYDRMDGTMEWSAESFTDPYEPTYWFVNDGADADAIYGTADPYCMTTDEVEELSEEWGVDLFEQMHEASIQEVRDHGTC